MPPPPRSTLFPYTTLFRSGPTRSERTSHRARPQHCAGNPRSFSVRSEEHTSELQSLRHLVCRLLLEKKKKKLWRHPTNRFAFPLPLSHSHTPHGIITHCTL